MLLKNLFNRLLRGMKELENTTSRVSGRPDLPITIPSEILASVHRILYAGPEINDPELLTRLPKDYADLLLKTNGFICYGGGLHVRGVCIDPDWHSLHLMWEGENALHQLYPVIRPDDIPFGEDCMGDQFILREGIVFRLFAEHGELESWAVNFKEFLDLAEDDPIGYLSLSPLIRFIMEGGSLEPGMVIDAWPPFCMIESRAGSVLGKAQALERIGFLSWFAGEIGKYPDGTQFEMTFESDRLSKEEIKNKMEINNKDDQT